MSADNWARCPKCLQEATAALRERLEKVNASYGVIPVEEFDQARAQWESDRVAHMNFPSTWREDYRIDGASEGIVTITYKGNCSVCKLKLEFDTDHPIPGL